MHACGQLFTFAESGCPLLTAAVTEAAICWNLWAFVFVSLSMTALPHRETRSIHQNHSTAFSKAVTHVIQSWQLPAALMSLTTSASRVRLVRVLSVQPGPAVNSTARRVWRWELTNDAPPSSTGPRPQAQLLCRSLSEALCSMLAASWTCGGRASVKANFAPLTDMNDFSGAAVTIAEQQVSWTATSLQQRSAIQPRWLRAVFNTRLRGLTFLEEDICLYSWAADTHTSAVMSPPWDLCRCQSRFRVKTLQSYGQHEGLL